MVLFQTEMFVAKEQFDHVDVAYRFSESDYFKDSGFKLKCIFDRELGESFCGSHKFTSMDDKFSLELGVSFNSNFDFFLIK